MASRRLTPHALTDILAPMKDAMRLLRIALTIKIALVILGAIFFELRFDIPVAAFSLLRTAPTAIVWLLTFVPPIERRLGRRYLPVFIGLTIVAQSIESGTGVLLVSSVPIEPWLGLSLAALAVSEPLFLLLVPTLLAAWAYGRRGGWLAAGFATGLHLLVALVAVAQGMPGRMVFPIVGFQFAQLFLASYIVGTLAERQRQQTEALSAANAQLREQAAAMEQLAVARERNRLARDLHDTLAHSLAGLVVQLQAIDTLMPSEPDAARAELVRARRTAQAGLEDARSAIRDLRVNPVEDLGLARAL